MRKSKKLSKIRQDKTQRCIETKHNLLLTHYFLVTFTLPRDSRRLARSNQKVVYNLLFKSSATELQKPTGDQRFGCGDTGVIGGLKTWRRDLDYPSHAHFSVPGGELSPDLTK